MSFSVTSQIDFQSSGKTSADTPWLAITKKLTKSRLTQLALRRSFLSARCAGACFKANHRAMLLNTFASAASWLNIVLRSCISGASTNPLIQKNRVPTLSQAINRHHRDTECAEVAQRIDRLGQRLQMALISILVANTYIMSLGN